MKKAGKGFSRVPSGSLHIPALCIVLCLLAPVSGALSFRQYWFTEHGPTIEWHLWYCLIALSLALAGMMTFWPKARDWVSQHLERTGRLRPAAHTLWSAVAYLGIFAYLFFLKYCQYRGFQLPLDSAATGNLAYNAIHARSLECSVLGVSSYLSVHFMPAIILWAPLLLVWNSLVPLMLLQTALVASIPLAVYRLVFHRTGSSLAGWAALWATFASPFFIDLASASIYVPVTFPAVFLWGIYFATTRRWKIAAASALLAALTIEEAPVVFFGLGIYLWARLGWRTRRACLVGAGVCVGSMLLWWLETRIIWSFSEAQAFGSWKGTFGHLAATPGALLLRTVSDPVNLIRQLVWPLDKLRPAWGLLASTGGLCLLAPLELVVWLINYLPHFVAPPQSFYHDIRLQYVAYCIGPLWWSVSMGLASAYSWLERKRREPWLFVLVLLLGAWNIRHGSVVLQPAWRWGLFTEGPVLVERIPKEASVWAYEYAAPWVACRSFLKVLPPESNHVFTDRLFVPDYVFLPRSWTKAKFVDPAWRDRILTFLAGEGYTKAAERDSFVLLQHPRAPLPRDGGRPPSLDIPQPGPAAASYGLYLQRNDDLPATAALYRRLALRGDERAQFNLGVALSEGQGVMKDHDEAVRWLRQAADQGLAEAQNSLGADYSSRGDWPKAAGWFRKAAEQGLPGAQENLGICYVTGSGVTRDIAEAVRWFRKAAEQGNVEAQYNLGVSLAAGQGASQDIVEAELWLRKAAEAGYEKAFRKLMELGVRPLPSRVKSVENATAGMRHD